MVAFLWTGRFVIERKGEFPLERGSSALLSSCSQLLSYFLCIVLIFINLLEMCKIVAFCGLILFSFLDIKPPTGILRAKSLSERFKQYQQRVADNQANSFQTVLSV